MIVFGIAKGDQASWINLKTFALVDPFDVIRVRVCKSLEIERLHHAKWSYIRTTPSIDDQGAHFSLDRAPWVEDVLPLFFFSSLEAAWGPSQDQQLTLIYLLYNLLLFLQKANPSVLFFLLLLDSLPFKQGDNPSIGTLRG